jgi:D-alanine-D-alanine ligase
MKKKIALVTGGYSGESEISYKSATTIYNNLDKDLFEVYTIDITPEGWFYIDENSFKRKVDKNDFSLHINGSKITFDAVFIGIHGTPGEDGKLQGYFDMLEIPYTSCNASTSAITFNKRYTVAVAALAGIHVANSAHLFKGTSFNSKNILSQLQLPLFIKPNNGGSSIGMSKVNDASELDGAIKKAFKEDDQVLVEEMIKGREFTVGVYKLQNKINVLPITEVMTQKDFFDFEAKYQGKSSEVTPAEISDDWKQEIEGAAQKIYEVFNCSGVVRIDFIYEEAKQKPYMLEINTVPGQSEASIIPQQVKAAGMTLKNFYASLVEEALTSSRLHV